MECGICSGAYNSRRKPICVSCIQATLYGPRIQQASALLDREKQHTHAEAVVRPGNDGVIASLPEDADWDAITAGVKKHSLARSREEQQAVDARVDDITNKAAELRREIEDYKAYVAKQKDVHATRRHEVAEERKQLEKHKQLVLDPVRSAIRKAHQRLEKVHHRTVDARALLCYEAASLSGLQRRKGEDGKSEYWLGGVAVPDLRALNGKLQENTTVGSHGEDKTVPRPHEVATAAMDNVCRLVGNCCHYLSVRLPAEILLPHNDFPHAMVVPERASYKLKDVLYSGMSSSQSSSPAASRFVDRHGVSLPRPRPLHLDRPLPDLVKDDTKAFSLFIEGVMLLAWDVAWLCKSQGVDTINSFDDVCAIGRNLHQLLIGQEQPRPPLNRNFSSATTRTDRSKGVTPVSAISLGFYSHGSAHHSLAGFEGLALLHGWRLASPARLVDKLKSYLLNEISGAEWDFLSDKEWDEERADELPVLVVGERGSGEQHGPAMSVMTVAPHDGADEERSEGKAKGSSGWMKLFEEHPQLNQIIHPLYPASSFGPERIWLGLRHSDAAEEAQIRFAEGI
ncbi:hypothetical protein LTR36_002986 [Oleoguttula mirabilis]|uniref:Autophagy-related protein 14 n=1 Tax=Oleoguttula mirabilis TaxID=1507867 RepID=A0AAV9JWK1_9PEZI|nr:hypothetical protein LTR36_002986 [Oleoguttula mirabilis]